MSVEVRVCADEAEFAQAFMQIGQYFGLGPGGDDAMSRFTNVLPLERMLVALDGTTVVGGTGSLPMGLSVPGGSLPCSGTTVVGVSPTHRRRGIARALIGAHLLAAHERDEPIAALWASEEGIYGRFGYGRASFAGEIAVPREYVEFDTPLEPHGQLRLLEPAEALELFPPLWETATRVRPGMVVRSPAWWKDRTIADPLDRRYGSGPKRFVLLDQDAKPAGYAIYRHRFGYEGGSTSAKVEVLEAVAAEPEAFASVWRYLLDMDWTATITESFVPPDHPLFFLLSQPRRMKYRMGDGLWVRLVDVGAALAGRTYPEDGEFVVEVRDELCPWNAGRWQVADGRRTDAPAELALDVGTLGAAYLGGVSLSTLAQGGRVEELKPGAIDRADGILRHGLHPWCPEIF